MFFQKYKKIIIILIVLVIVFLGISFIRGGSVENDDSDLLVSSNVNVENQAQLVSNEIVSALNQIQNLKLNKDIFEDKVFQSLIDRSQEIPEEPIGKTNPFSPIGRQNVQNRRATTTPPTNNTIINTTNNRPTTDQPVL